MDRSANSTHAAPVARGSARKTGASSKIGVPLKAAVLVGTGGIFTGESFKLEPLHPTVVGRSRDADISVKRTDKYRQMSEDERFNDEATQTISAKHFQITLFSLRSIEVRNLSVNGTYLDGRPLDKPVVIEDLSRRAHEIAFGVNARMKLELRAL
jgi:hypothetical protein